MVNEEIATAGKAISGLTCLDAQDIRIEQAKIGPFFEINDSDALNHFTLQQQTESTQPFRLHPFAFRLCSMLPSERMHGIDVQQRLAHRELTRRFVSFR